MIEVDPPSVEDFPLIEGKDSAIMVRLAAGLRTGGVTKGPDPLRTAKADYVG
jgi:hypothetical protein